MWILAGIVASLWALECAWFALAYRREKRRASIAERAMEALMDEMKKDGAK